jgi:hypothetical protein
MSPVMPLVKFGLGMYYGQASSPYAKAAAALGYEEDVRELQAAYQEGGADCRTRVEQLLDAGADRLIVTMAAATRAECEPLLEGIIPDGYR